jgi:dipeptidyl aminopeptidase/acylaminoacyl peptidase
VTRRAVAALLTLAAFACGNVAFVAPVGAVPKKLLDYHAYSAWRQIRDVRLSRDGRRLAYAQVAAADDGELLVRDLAGPAVFRAPRGRAAQFSPDGRFVVYRISAPVADVKAAEKAAKPPDQRPKDGLGIADLADITNPRTTAVERVRSFALSRDGTTLAYLLEPSPSPSPSASMAPAASASPAASTSPAPVASVQPSPSPHPAATAPAAAAPAATPAASASPASAASSAPKAPGKDAAASLAIQRLGDAGVARVANVSAYAVSADGSHVAYVVQTKTDENIHVRNAATGKDQLVAHGVAHLASPVLSPDGASLAYLSDPDAYDEAVKKESGARSPFRLMVADTRTGAVVEALGDATPGLAPRTFASDAHKPEFSADGSRLALWTANVPLPRPSSAPARVDLDFWYWRNGELPTQQRRAAEKPEHGTNLALYDLAARRVTQLGTREVPQISLAGNARYALGASDVPYVKLATYDDSYYDVYRIDAATGARTLLERKAKSEAPSLSPAGRYALGYDPLRRAWYTLRLADGRKAWITDPRTVRAAVEDDDHPAPPPPYGAGGWTPGDRGVLIYDRYDVWLASPDGGAPVALTHGAGRAAQRIYRVVRPRTDEPDNAFVAGRPVFGRAPYLLSVVDDRTKASGFATLASLAPQTPRVTMLLDKAVGVPWRGRDGGGLVFTEQRFDEFPDLWSGAPLPSAATRISDANPQAAQYAWGRSRLIGYTTARGEKLRAILTVPDGFDPHKRYPMLVYVYEKMTNGLHEYIVPSSGTVVNLARYANHGYVVLQPDIRYRIGHTTASAVDCVGSAVKRVVAMGFVDPKRIGMAGHSYGGYEVNALVTHTGIFRAVESGASDSDLPSLYGGFWESGDVQQAYYERSQGRIGATPWQRPDLYVENSPLFFVQHVRAPYLRIQNDEDGAVPYGQGVEFFTALRRAGKEAYMFSFIGEKHGLTKQPNRDYWTVHLDEFFDHFLLGAPRPDWMNHNATFEHRGERDVESLFTPAKF